VLTTRVSGALLPQQTIHTHSSLAQSLTPFSCIFDTLSWVLKIPLNPCPLTAVFGVSPLVGRLTKADFVVFANSDRELICSITLLIPSPLLLIYILFFLIIIILSYFLNYALLHHLFLHLRQCDLYSQGHLERCLGDFEVIGS